MFNIFPQSIILPKQKLYLLRYMVNKPCPKVLLSQKMLLSQSIPPPNREVYVLDTYYQPYDLPNT